MSVPSQSQSQSPTTTRTTPPQAIPTMPPISVVKPEPGSLRHLIITNPSKRLYVRPELWTVEILRFLDCFCELPTRASSTTTTTETETETATGMETLAIMHPSLHAFRGHPSYVTAYYALRKFDFARHTHHKDNAIQSLFADLVELVQEQDNYVIRNNLNGLPLFFNQKRVAKVYCPWLVCNKEILMPMCAFIDVTWMNDNRKKYFPGRAFRARQARMRNNGLVLSVKSTQPSPIDPYFVALMIAMAQMLSRNLVSSERDQPSRSFHLFTPSQDRNSLTLYTAKVTPDFLKKFDYAYQRFDSCLSITQQDVPINPPTALLTAIKDVLESDRQSNLNNTSDRQSEHDEIPCDKPDACEYGSPDSAEAATDSCSPPLKRRRLEQ